MNITIRLVAPILLGACLVGCVSTSSQRNVSEKVRSEPAKSQVVKVVSQPTPSTDDLWDISRGAAITAHSRTLRSSPSSSPCDIRDMFGGRFSPAFAGTDGPADYVIFADGADGFVNCVEWVTASPVTVRAFNLWANGDAPPYQEREMGSFRLLAKSPGSSTYDVVLYTFTPAHPYTWVDGVMSWVISSEVNPTTAREFRAEFGNYVPNRSMPYGPRIVELDGFGEIHTGIQQR